MSAPKNFAGTAAKEFLPIFSVASGEKFARTAETNFPDRYENRGSRNLLPIIFHVGSILFLVLSALSCMIALNRNTQVLEKNLEILREMQQRFQSEEYIAQFDYLEEIPLAELKPSHRVRRMADQANSCPPCPTTPAPTPIEPHRNPVSVLNEEVGPGVAVYNVSYLCEGPHIHHASVVLNDHGYEGESWIGKGRNKANAKQAAAWNVINEELPHLIEKVAAEYRPPLYDPICKRPHPVENSEISFKDEER